MLSPARPLLAEPAGMFNRGIFGGGAHIPFPHLKTTIVTNQDDDDGGACFYPSDFPPTPAGVCNSPGGLDESFGIEAYLSGTDENQMDQEHAVEEGGHGQNYGDAFVPMLSTSMVTSVKTEPELLQVVPGLLGQSRRPSLPSSHSSTSLVTQASDHDLCNENEASPNIGSSCECGDPQCIEASSALANVSTSVMGSRSLTRFSREPSSRGQSVAHSGGTSQSEVFSTITAEEACTRQGLECEFVMELEDPQPSMEDESLAFADYYQQQQEGLLPASSKPVSPLISRMLGDTDMIDPTKLPSTATQSADGFGLWYSSGGGRPPARSALRPRRNSADKQYAFDRRARYGVLGCKSAEAMKQEAEAGRGNPNSKEAAIPDYLRGKPLSKSKAPALRHSRSEPALLRGTRWASPHPEGVARPGYGGCYGTGMIPASSMLPPRSSQSSVELASCSASSQVRTQIQTYTQSKASHREENSNSPSSAGLRLDPRSLHLTSSSSSGLSASALISRAAAGMNIPGCSSDTSSIGMGFSKLATAAAAASGNLQTSQQQQQHQHQQQHQQQQQVDGGLRLVQILVNCAEAVACRDSRQASSLLQTLQRLASPYGDAMQRVAACFLDGLSVRIYSSPAGFKSSGNSAAMAAVPPARMRAGPSDRERHEGFSLLCQSCPYVRFGHYTANTAMMEAFAGEDELHVIDLGMSHGLQWPGLIRSLASRAGGKPRSLRITGVGLNAAKMAEAGEQLDRVAREADLAFTFRIVKESLENLDRTMLDLRDGEALAVNSVLQLHCVVKESRGSLNAVLQSIHDLSPKILTLVEQDASHNGPFFMGRFVEALHYYSAIFDSLDATLPRYSTQRVKIEQFHYAEEIRNIVSCEGPARVERHERIDQWRRRMSRAGFQPQPLKFLHDTRRWLASYDCPGYTLAEEKGCLVLGWNSKPIIAASSWRC